MSWLDRFPPTTTRVAMSTAPQVNRAIQERTDGELIRLEKASMVEISARLRQLDHEWDVERVLQTNASIISLVGLVLGTRMNRRFLLLPTAVFAFLAQHALQGWCPPTPIFRRLGVRTMREIERERHALKALRGDFDKVPSRKVVFCLGASNGIQVGRYSLLNQ